MANKLLTPDEAMEYIFGSDEPAGHDPYNSADDREHMARLAPELNDTYEVAP